MALPVYLAMTAAELTLQETLPEYVAWMACHFSSYSQGLSNLPRQLPEGSMLILNDRIPIQGQLPQVVTQQLQQLIEDFSVCGVLLDFQRPRQESAAEMVQAVTQALKCPVAVTEQYATDTNCAVFLEAPRAYHPLQERLKPWKGREIWLEASYSPGTVSVTEEGSFYEPGVAFPPTLPLQTEEKLHCTYCSQESEGCVRYYFHRTPQQLKALLEEAQALGIKKAIGLYQELKEW